MKDPSLEPAPKSHAIQQFLLNPLPSYCGQSKTYNLGAVQHQHILLGTCTIAANDLY